MYGETGSDTAYATPNTYEAIRKSVVAVISSDNFRTWDSIEEEEINPFTVWSPDGTALWTSDVNIAYCYANIALEIKPVIIRNGVEYHISYVYGASGFNAFSKTYDEETDEDVYTYVGTSLNKIIPAEFVDDSTFIVTVPYIANYTRHDTFPDGYSIVTDEFIIMIYEDEERTNVIQKIQPIYYEPYEE